ncbi:MAG TPA: hypothetical protein DCG75_19705 [Bacteroidales bacterium]|jgi:hypothetical protein|nr:hypothetical protein [Bacteroidales bacterium]
MKNITLLSLLLFSINLLFGQLPGEKKWKENIAKNRIQKQVQWNYKYEKGKPKKEGYKNYTKKFDHNGNIIEEIYYQSGSVDQKLSYKYDDNENKVEYVNYQGDETKVMFKQNITYDNSMRKIREERYDGTDYQIIKYNYQNNKLTEIIRSDVYGNIEHQRNFNYSGNICTVSILDEKSNSVGRIINKYDDNDNLIESTEYDINGKIKEQYFYTFKGNLVKEKTKFILENFIYKEEYEYDSKGNLIKVIKEEPRGNLFVNNIYKYDSKGNLIEEEWYDDSPTENSKKTYFYDEKGILEKVEVYYALYRYKIQYKFEYTYY